MYELSLGGHVTSLTGHQLATHLTGGKASLRLAGRSGHRPVCCALVLFAADGLAALVSTATIFWFSGLLRGEFNPFASLGPPSVFDTLLAPFIALLVYLAAKGRYVERIPFWTEARLILSASLCVAGLEAASDILTRGIADQSATVAVFLLFPVLSIAANRFAKGVLVRVASWTIPVVMLGDGPTAAAAEEALKSDRSLGYRIVGRIDPESIITAPGGPRLLPVLERFGGNRLLVAIDGEGPLQRQVIECALREGIRFAIVPQAFPAFVSETSRFLSHDATLLSFHGGLSRPVSRIMKGTMDVVLAAMLLILAAPLFLAIVVVSRLDGGPIFFSHGRVGAGGRAFRCLKFRTMMVDSDQVLRDALARDSVLADEWQRTRKLTCDPRVTPFGSFLRRTSLDELPQLINVLRRDMSLVGPRPIVESEIPLYGENIAQYYATRPGLTGLWQVCGRSTTSYARRVQLDVWYVNNWTIWHDVVVLLKTVPVVLGRQGAC
jgi:Undecaprenyl-phosphate galactose phosphotransferase WbaP